MIIGIRSRSRGRLGGVFNAHERRPQIFKEWTEIMASTGQVLTEAVVMNPSHLSGGRPTSHSASVGHASMSHLTGQILDQQATPLFLCQSLQNYEIQSLRLRINIIPSPLDSTLRLSLNPTSKNPAHYLRSHPDSPPLRWGPSSTSQRTYTRPSPKGSSAHHHVLRFAHAY
jgi:hypothetical protein